MLQLFASVLFELFRDAHVLRAFDHLGIHHVGDDRLVFPRQIFVQAFDQLFARHGRGVRARCCRR
jgi:hypothetical protein